MVYGVLSVQYHCGWAAVKLTIVHGLSIVLLRLRQSLLRSITIDLSKKNRDVDSMSHGHVD